MPWLAKIRSFAAAVGVEVAVAVEVVGGEVEEDGALGGEVGCVSSSWKLEHSQTTVASGSTSPTSSESGVPTLPATATGSPAPR